MSATLILLELAGYVALLLWGVHMVQSGIQRAFGPNLRRVLGSTLGNRGAALLAGLGVTALLQSSTATGLMAASFAGQGLVDLVPALAIMLGANVGTTLIVQVLSFDIAGAAPLLILLGVVLARRTSASRTRDIGHVAIGLGLVLLALIRLISVTTPTDDAHNIRTLLGMVADPLLYILISALLTWAAHSSVAVVLFVMSLAGEGAIPLDGALALVIGANLGSALNPLFEGSRKAELAGRRVAIGNLINRITGAAVALALLPYLGPLLTRLDADPSRAVANFHLIFNLTLAAAFLPLLGPLARWLERWMPANVQTSRDQPAYLDAAALETPPVALGNAAREALRMADVLAEMLRNADRALLHDDRSVIASSGKQEDVIDNLNRAIKTYVTSIEPDATTPEDRRRAAAILSFTTNVEHAGDILDRNVMAQAAKRLDRGLSFSAEGKREIGAMISRLELNLRTA